jgi:hypothetical protein
MKKFLLPIGMFAVIIFSGCSTTISDYLVTERDKEIYKNPNVTTKDYAKVGYVLETRGSGEIACINLGQAKGVKKGTKIVFYTMITRMGKRYQVPFAEGRVSRVGDDSSWVVIKSYATAGVKENHFAKIAADQSYTFGEKMAFPPRFFKKK